MWRGFLRRESEPQGSSRVGNQDPKNKGLQLHPRDIGASRNGISFLEDRLQYKAIRKVNTTEHVYVCMYVCKGYGVNTASMACGVRDMHEEQASALWNIKDEYPPPAIQ